MARIIAVANQKGGVGKTTTSINLAASMAELGRRVLLVDMDPQGNATMGSGVDKQDIELSCYDVLLEDCDPFQAVVSSQTIKHQVLPSNMDLAGAEVHLLEAVDRDRRLKKAISILTDNYDYIFIDCPPSMNMLTINALVAADSVLVPMQCEYFALEGLSSLMDTLKQVQETVNKNLSLEGLLRTMFDGRSRLTREVSEQLTAHFSERLFETIVPRNVRLAEAPSFGLPAILYDKSSRGAQAYMDLARELDEKHY
ncbi:ParA family protein [Cycloclasticus pugetii]|uniref:ParA family protein n=1 Tax=Cycloclasticus pugetii TaxID=34068 RepID=UPI0009177E17|nr:ParA family protein [Cycloclasticus pugetii]SHJ67725.1 chromosome segregation ATPase [Cycloclasticus pugetii]